MNKYETIMILNPDLSDDEIRATIDKVENLMKENGELLNEELWGRRKLAYPISKKNTGYYVLINFKADMYFIDELNNLYNVTEEIIKHIVVKQEEE